MQYGAEMQTRARGATVSAVCALAFLTLANGLCIDVAHAQAASAGEQQRLYEQMVRQPTNYEITFAYVKVATARGDYEAAIGALERLLFYNPDLPAVKYELGTLYYRLRAHDMARRYYREALASRNLDAVTKERIEASLATADQQAQQSRFAGFAQTGVRYQSNASLAPAGGAVRIGGQDFGLSPTQSRKSDGNWFGLAGVSYDYDLPTGVTLETRGLGYLTQQFSLHDLDVGILDGTFGVRIPLSIGSMPGASIKPYVAGGNTWVGGSQYMSSYGAGLSLYLPVTTQFTVEPLAEWRHVNFTIDPTLSSYATGDWYSAGLLTSYLVSDSVKIDARGYFRRGESDTSFQDFNQWAGEAAVSFRFAAPFPWIVTSWAFSPFARMVRTEFDAPNPAIDPVVTRADTQWVAGAVFDTPVNRTFGLSTTVQYDWTDSNISTYRQNNLSILSGPTVRF
jgi:hypothetical protein